MFRNTTGSIVPIALQYLLFTRKTRLFYPAIIFLPKGIETHNPTIPENRENEDPFDLVRIFSSTYYFKSKNNTWEKLKYLQLLNHLTRMYRYDCTDMTTWHYWTCHSFAHCQTGKQMKNLPFCVCDLFQEYIRQASSELQLCIWEGSLGLNWVQVLSADSKLPQE